GGRGLRGGRGVGRAEGRPPGARRERGPARGRGDRDARRPGGDQRERGPRARADQGHRAAVRLVRRLLARRVLDRRRPAAQHLAARSPGRGARMKPIGSRRGAYVMGGGGTGGQVFPGMGIAEELKTRRPDAPIVFVGTSKGLEGKLVPQAGFQLELVEASGFVGKTLSERIAALRRLPDGVRAARKLLVSLDARAVVGIGGYASVP